nr:MAG TPA: hypothetical protein [Bacteriophage sp.]
MKADSPYFLLVLVESTGTFLVCLKTFIGGEN